MANSFSPLQPLDRQESLPLFVCMCCTLSSSLCHREQTMEERARPSRSGDAVERVHLLQVLCAFKEYRKYTMHEVDRRWSRLCKLRPEQATRLPPSALSPKLHATRNAVEVNQAFLEAVSERVSDLTAFEQLEVVAAAAVANDRIRTSPDNISKIRATLRSCMREWSAEGAAERDACFGAILDAIKRRLPVTRDNRHKQRVLVPGAGLGRLPLEIVASGYACQGNEFSYFMLLTSNYILNHVMEAASIPIHPFVDQTCNVINSSDSLREVLIPDVAAGELLATMDEDTDTEGGHVQLSHEPCGAMPDFSMTAGEFLEVYGNQVGCWDCVVTCFFLDTAPVVLDYVEVIHRLLRPGGLWVNFGPLLYHWASPGGGQVEKDEDNVDNRYHRSVELTWEELRHVIVGYGFVIEEERMQACQYSCNQRSMMKTVYDCVFFCATRPMDAASAVASETSNQKSKATNDAAC